MTAPKPGDRVKIAYEATFTRHSGGLPGFFARTDSGVAAFVPRDADVQIVTPALTFEPGDVARVGGNVALRVLGGWAFCDGSRLKDDELAGRTLTPLVLAGKPVNAA